ncbi:MAG: diguanylate cyclase [Acidobacteriota bacterium]|nr:diguanylate cyclase [Acidobacteriota bacterium]
MQETKGEPAEERESFNLNATYEAVREISLARNPDDLLARLLQKAISFSQPEIASFLIKDQPSDGLRYSLILGEKADKWKDRLVRKGEGACGLAAETNQNIIMTDTRNDPRFNSKVDNLPDFEIKSLMAIPFRVERTVFGVIYLINGPGKKAFSLEEFKLLQILVNFTELMLERIILLTELKQLDAFDSLTQTYNSKTFFHYFQREIERCQRHGYDLSLLRIDVDYFEKIVQTFGPEAGERVLTNLSFILKKVVRQIDLVSRIEMHEFLVLLPDTNAASAVQLKERLMKIFNSQDLTSTGIPYTVTAEVFSEEGARTANLCQLPRIKAWIDQIKNRHQKRKYATSGEELAELARNALLAAKK